MDLGDPFDVVYDAHEPAGLGSSSGDVCASVIVRELASRPKPDAHVVVFANEKGGVGKSTLAFHCCVALASAGRKVLAVDLDRRQRSLDTVLLNRDATARALQVDIPRPRHIVLQRQSGAMLHQEIMREGHDCDFVIVDAAGHDSTIARHAMAMADTLITPVNNSSMDLALLGRFDALSGKLKEPGCFAALVDDLRREKERYGMGMPDWIVLRNRVRDCEVRQKDRSETLLDQLAPALGFRLGRGFGERVAYRELFTFGLTHLDLRYFPKLARIDTPAANELHRMMDDLDLPDRTAPVVAHDRRWNHKPLGKPSTAFGASLYEHMQPLPRKLASAG